MKIAICGSATAIERIHSLKRELEDRGHEVYAPRAELHDEAGQRLSSQEYVQRYRSSGELSLWALQVERGLMREYFPILTKVDAVLIANFSKKGVEYYIGGSTFLEMSIACYLNKPIYLLNPIPQGLLYTEDILLINPQVIDADLSKIIVDI